jgi:hypothetical protein
VKKLNVLIITLFLSVFITGCDSLPEHIIKNHERTVVFIDKSILKGSTNLQDFKIMKASEEFKFILDYEKTEQWESKINSINANLVKEKIDYIAFVKPLLERDESKDGRSFSNYSFKISASNIELIKKSDGIIDYIKKIALFSNNKEKYFNDSRENFKSVEINFNKLKLATEKYTNKYPIKTVSLDAKFIHAQGLLKTADNLLNIITEQYNSKVIDLNVFAFNILAISDLKNEMRAYIKKTNTLLSELDVSYIKILKAERVDYFVNLGFSSWCESDGCGSGDEGYRKVQVTEDVYELADSTNANVLIQLNSGWSSVSSKPYVGSKLINGLKINTKHIPNRNSTMEYWINSVEEKTWHQYTVIENDIVKVDDSWNSVPNSFFYKFEGMLGMPIYSKPYGYYNSEATKESTNVLAQTISEPVIVNGVPTGSNQYGQWQTNNGNSFFHYYGQYAMLSSLMGNDHNYYSRSGGYSYSGYNNNPTRHKATFRNNQKNGVSNSSRFSSYNKGVVSKYRPSVRSAGSSSRSKGPSGGGK